MKIIRREPLKKHTSFRIGGPADYFCVPQNLADLQAAVAFARDNKLAVAVLGAGTNLLALDRGFRGLVIKFAGGLRSLSLRNRVIHAGAGVLLPTLVARAGNEGLTGLEFLAGIPGTVGGAVVMNAGAWGKEIGRYLLRVTVMDRAGKIKVLKPGQLRFGYRRSLLQKGNYFLVEAVFRLRRGSRSAIKARIDRYLKERRAKQPLGSPNAGSIFKNPPGRFAGQILEAAGCKGLRVGDAQVSPKHANFIVNLGEAKAGDVLRLMTKMLGRAKMKLEPEIKIMVKSDQ
ncbi:MAG: UDP-N-acetylmuramate dehydrogenase [Candidatus Margulisbacteria bacterium]|jgi:UDP-N-acetylmuramate dehydrogenase|nr:UDP-N-acetylmuramate dehydrogenase [Candidatus Margulisiibacteriota bacterium]